MSSGVGDVVLTRMRLVDVRMLATAYIYAKIRPAEADSGDRLAALRAMNSAFDKAISEADRLLSKVVETESPRLIEMLDEDGEEKLFDIPF